MWNISKASYYADWVTIPFLGCVALISDVSYRGGLPFITMLMFALGFALWSFVEYAAHRWIFHRAYRKEHWIHHIRPKAYVGVPAWQTGLLFLMALGGTTGGFGIDIGAGLFSGFCASYFLYIWAHDKFHHGATVPGSYWDRRRRSHDIHHARGIEANFGVVSPVWDVLLGTYRTAV